MSTEGQDLPQFPSDEEVDQMVASQGSATKDAREPEDVLALEDDTEVFTKGFCHAFALELGRAFARVGRPIEFVYLATPDIPELAAHVLVRIDGSYFDVRFGPQSEMDVLGLWGPKIDGRVRSVGHEGWLTHPASTPTRTHLGLAVGPKYFGRARDRAARFIAKNRARFGLPEERGG